MLGYSSSSRAQCWHAVACQFGFYFHNLLSASMVALMRFWVYLSAVVSCYESGVRNRLFSQMVQLRMVVLSAECSFSIKLYRERSFSSDFNEEACRWRMTIHYCTVIIVREWPLSSELVESYHSQAIPLYTEISDEWTFSIKLYKKKFIHFDEEWCRWRMTIHYILTALWLSLKSDPCPASSLKAIVIQRDHSRTQWWMCIIHRAR